MGFGVWCHFPPRREVRVRALDGEGSGGGKSLLWERVDTMIAAGRVARQREGAGRGADGAINWVGRSEEDAVRRDAKGFDYEGRR